MVFLPHAFGIGTDASPRSIAFGNISGFPGRDRGGRADFLPCHATETQHLAAPHRMLAQ